MKTEKELQDFLFENNHDAFSIAAAVQCAFRLLEKDTMFIADAVKVHLQHEILEFAESYAQQRVQEYRSKTADTIEDTLTIDINKVVGKSRDRSIGYNHAIEFVVKSLRELPEPLPKAPTV